jgi:hypothetical protein
LQILIFEPYERKKVMGYTLDQLMTLSQQQLDDLFKQSPAGPIPNGKAEGRAIIAPGTQLEGIAAKFIHHYFWQGKVFDAQAGTLRNEILPIGIQEVMAKVYKDKSWVDGNEAIILDYSKTSLVAQWIRDEIRLVGDGVYLGVVFWEKDKLINFALKFPA